MATIRKTTSAQKVVKTTKIASAVKDLSAAKTPQSLKTIVSSAGISRRTMIIVLIVAAVIIAGVLLRNQIIVATVNGKPISRLSLIAELERQSGKKTLDVLITKNLIFQEAENKNVVASEADITSETKKIEANLKKQGQDLNALLLAQGMSQAELKEQIKIQIIVKKLLAKEIAVSDKEVNDYIAKNKDAMPKDISEAALKVEVKAQLEQQKLSQASNKFVTSLREKAKINYFLNFK
jgi:foldase protein PrsA